jgi:thiamine-phosphate pyrophosphorylase
VVGSVERARERLQSSRLYVISADAEPAIQADVLCAAIDGGADIVQLRNKVSPAAALLAAARRIADHARGRGALFIVNDEPELVAPSGADGVHVGQGDGATALVRARLGRTALLGRSTHSLEQALAAEADGADYIGVGPVHETPTKPGRPAVGLELVAAVAARVGVPWFAIGGLHPGNVGPVIAAGATRVAVVRAVAGAPEPAAAAAELAALLTRIGVTA